MNICFALHIFISFIQFLLLESFGNSTHNLMNLGHKACMHFLTHLNIMLIMNISLVHDNQTYFDYIRIVDMQR